MEPLHIINVYPETISDGFGVRYAIYLAGCTHHCRGCHNPGSWSPVAGEPLTELILSRIVAEINDNPILDGITISGGDPFYNPFALLALLRRLKEETHKNVWCYTGYTYESLLKDETRRPCLDYIDTLVDGPFINRSLIRLSLFGAAVINGYCICRNTGRVFRGFIVFDLWKSYFCIVCVIINDNYECPD